MVKTKQLNFSSLVICLLVIGVVLFVGCKSNHPIEQERETSPKGLTVEYIRQPENVLIIDSTPEFAWELPSSSIKQSGYQILVASKKELIDKEAGDLWDTKKVTSSKSIDVTYKGKPLEIGKIYYWKVKTWGEKDQETPFSEYQTFTVGRQENIITSANSFQVDSITTKNYKKLSNNSYFIDFGKDAFANLHFFYESKDNDTLIFHIGEQLLNGKINRKPKGTIRYQKIKIPISAGKQEYLLPIKPDRRNTKEVAIKLPDSFPVVMPFRYVEVENFKKNFNINDFTQLTYHSYWEEDASSFKSSDSILNQVWDLCKYSIKATTFAGVYVDGDRERIPYEADAYLNQLSHYTTDKEYAMARQTIEYFMEQPTWPTEWQLHVALMFYADYMYTGNTELIEKYYDDLRHKTLYELVDEQGLITSENITDDIMLKLGFKEGYKKPLADIVDWPSAGWGGDPNNLGERDGYVFKKYNTVVNAFYFQNMKIMTEFATILEKEKDIVDFKLRAEKSKKAIQKAFFDEKRGFYVDGIGTTHASLHANMLPLAFGLVPEQNIKSVVEFMKSRGMACSVYGAQYLMDALYNAGEAEYALKLMTSKAERSWYNMIREGSTITMEAWGYKYKKNLDWNHAWGAIPANVIPRGMWGITPKTPGYSIAVINPQLGSLQTSSIVVPTLRGQIKANYILQADNTQKYIIDIPANMQAEFTVKESFKVKINHKYKDPKKGVVYLEPGKNLVEVFN